MNLYEQISYKGHHINVYYDEDALDPRQEFDHLGTLYRSEERRVGKECRSRRARKPSIKTARRL